MTRGWVRFWRKAVDNEIMKDGVAWHIFTWLLLKVDRTTGKKKTGRFWAAEELGMKPITFYKGLKRLEKKYKMVTLVVTGKSTEISLINWHRYQSGNTSGNTSVTHEEHIGNTLQEVRSKNKEYIPNGIVHVIDTFNKNFGTQYKPTDGRRRKLQTRLKSFTLEEVLSCIDNMSRESFYRGENDRGWSADPDYLLRSDEMIDKWRSESKVRREKISIKGVLKEYGKYS